MESMIGYPATQSRRLSRRILLPAAICLLGIALLIGCIPIPIPEHKVTGTDFRRFAGEEGQQLHDGVTTRAAVLAHLGRPQMESEDKRFVAYSFQTNAGFWVAPLCFHVSPSNRYFLLILEYDPHGVLVQHRPRHLFNSVSFITYEYSPDEAKQLFAGDFQYFASHGLENDPTTRPK